MKIFKRLWCRIVGHRNIKVFTDIKITEATLFGIRGEVQEYRMDCQRCGMKGRPVRPVRVGF